MAEEFDDIVDHGLEGTRPRCRVCIAHPGWGHDDESSRREPADVCANCLGSGVKQWPVVPQLLTRVRRLQEEAVVALDNEAEHDYRLAVLRLENVAATLAHVARTW